MQLISDNFLLKLSSHVRSIHIMRGKDKALEEKLRFLGADNRNWAPVFVEMLSKKLNKLYISNVRYPGYLDNLDTIHLQEVKASSRFIMPNIDTFFSFSVCRCSEKSCGSKRHAR